MKHSPISWFDMNSRGWVSGADLAESNALVEELSHVRNATQSWKEKHQS